MSKMKNECEVKPCKFCIVQPVIVKCLNQNGKLIWQKFICPKCGWYSYSKNTELESIEEWNDHN